MKTKIHEACAYPGCEAAASHDAADDSAEWSHVCDRHLAFSFRPDAWQLIETGDANFEAWRHQYVEAPAERDPNEPILAPSTDVIDHMMFWHGGQGSPLYAAASCWMGGHIVKRETAEAALEELQRMSHQPHFAEADAEALAELEAHLNGEEV